MCLVGSPEFCFTSTSSLHLVELERRKTTVGKKGKLKEYRLRLKSGHEFNEDAFENGGEAD